MDSISRLHLCSHLLRQALQSFCNDSEWIYAIFWRIIPRHFPPPKWELGGYLDRSKANKRNWILVWEDGYCDFARSVLVIDHDEEQAAAAVAPANGSPALAAAADILMEKTVHSGMQPELFFKMSHEVYNYGEGLMGKVAADNGHKWIYKDPPERDNRLVAFWHNTIDPQPRTWEAQFKAGVQTIAVVSVREGIVQLASVQQVLEDVNFVAMVQRKFNSALQQTMMSPSLLLQQPTAPYNFPVPISPCNIATTGNANITSTAQYHHHQWDIGVNMIGGGGKYLYNNATLTSPDSLMDRKLLVRHHDEMVRDNQNDDDEEPPFRRTLERRLSWNETVSDSRRRSALLSIRNATTSCSSAPIISPSPTARLLAEAQLGLSENSLLAWYNPTTTPPQPAPSSNSPFSTTKPEEATIAPTSTAAALNVITTSCLKIDLPTTSSSSLSSPSSSSSSSSASASTTLSASVLSSMSSLQAPLSRLPAVTKVVSSSPSPTTSAAAATANCSTTSCKTVHTSSFTTTSQNGHVLRQLTPNIILKSSSSLDHSSPLMRTLSAPATAGCRNRSNRHLFTNCHPIPASSLSGNPDVYPCRIGRSRTASVEPAANSGNPDVYPCRIGRSRTAAVEPAANSAYTKAANTSMQQDISKTKPSVSASTVGIEMEGSSMLGLAVPNSAAAVGASMVNVKENDLAFIQPNREDHTHVTTSTAPSLVLTAPIGSDNNHDGEINAKGEIDCNYDMEEEQCKDGSNIVQQRCQVAGHIISDRTVIVSDTINNTTADFTDLALHTYLQDIESEEASADDCKN